MFNVFIRMMVKKFANFLSLYCIFYLLVVFNYASASSNNDENNIYYEQFKEAFVKVMKEYVTEPDKQKITDAAIQGMLNSLDSHSMYLVDDDLEDFMDHTNGYFCGIGVEIIYKHKIIKVISPIDDYPAEQAGILAGDYIIAVDDEKIYDMSFSQAIKKIRGEEGTKVKITILREGENKPKNFEITRAVINAKSVKYHIDNNIGYLRISTFNKHTFQDFKTAMKKLQAPENKLIGLILDVRNNPGGLLDQAVKVCEYFIDSGIIVTTKGRIKSSCQEYHAIKLHYKAPKIPMVVLINGGSASGAEIFAGAMQDNNKAVIMGTKSFGKASVQSFINLNQRKASAVKLTTAQYYTPSGRLIHEEGIIPDIEVDQVKVENLENKDEILQKAKKSLSEEEEDKDLEKKDKKEEKNIFRKPDIFKGDYQYIRAQDLIKSLNIMNERNGS